MQKLGRGLRETNPASKIVPSSTMPETAFGWDCRPRSAARRCEPLLKGDAAEKRERDEGKSKSEPVAA